MTKRWKPATDERGQGTLALVVVIVVLVAAVGLLLRTAALASSINEKTESIAATGRGINASTDAIIQLDRTNEFGSSILDTSEPLQGQLDRVVAIAQSIDNTATSINSSAVKINGTARNINATANGIQAVAGRINDGVAQINRNVDTTIGIAQRIKSDTGNILAAARTTHRLGACINQGLPGGTSDGHCR